MCFRSLGKALGYPDCCIDYFDKRITQGDEYPPEDSKFYGEGFIPCPECNKLPKNFLIDWIMARRDIGDLTEESYHWPREERYRFMRECVFNKNPFRRTR